MTWRQIDHGRQPADQEPAALAAVSRAMCPRRSHAWTLLIAATACATTPEPAPRPAAAPTVAPVTSPPVAPPPAPPPAPDDAAVICAGMNPDAPERVRVHIEQAILECAEGRLDRCEGEARYTVANCSDEPVLLRMLVFGDTKRSRATKTVEPDDGNIAPRSVWRWKTRVFHEASEILRVDVVDGEGAPIVVAEQPVVVSNPARVAAMAACEACGGTWGVQGLIYYDGCNCRTRDAGKECRSGEECEGACKFDHWAISAPASKATCPPRRLCARPVDVGRPIGRCSDRVAIRSCHKLLKPNIAGEPDQPLPWGVSHVCVD